MKTEKRNYYINPKRDQIFSDSFNKNSFFWFVNDTRLNSPLNSLNQASPKDIKERYINLWNKLTVMTKQELEQMWTDYEIYQEFFLISKLPAEINLLILDDIENECLSKYSRFQKVFLRDFRYGMDRIQSKQQFLLNQEKEKVLAPKLSPVTALANFSQPHQEAQILCQQIASSKTSNSFWIKKWF